MSVWFPSTKDKKTKIDLQLDAKPLMKEFVSLIYVLTYVHM